jgi:hypothetical protein
MNLSDRHGLARPILLAGLAALAAFAAGCDDESGTLLPNQEPNTRISAGPPEQKDTSFEVALFWYGWDEDGEVSHYEVAWETTDNWIGPIFATDSLFVLEASDTCCVDPLPEYGTILPDSVYSQFHTFYVRAVDGQGVPDPTPAVRSFNAKTIAPHTEVNFGPQNNQFWSSNVQFNWTGIDDDGIVVSYERLLTNSDEFEYEFGRPPSGTGELLAWIDTLTYRPIPGGGYSDERVWVPTDVDSVVYPNVQPRVGAYIFAVRSIDNAGAKEKVLSVGENVRSFGVQSDLDGPRITLTSNAAGVWRSGETESVRDIFAGQGLLFRWTAIPGPSTAAVAGFSHAVEDTANWSAFTPTDKEWPEQTSGSNPVYWFPPSGTHKFFVRAVDIAGFVRVIVASIRTFLGPKFEPPSSRYILAVLDSDPESIQNSGVWPIAFPQIERSFVEFYLFEGYNFQIHSTQGGRDRPPVPVLNFASSTFWFHGSDVQSFDGSIFLNYHETNQNPNVLPSYIRSGGNLFVCGIQPLNAMRFFEDIDEAQPVYQLQDPVDFSRTIPDTSLVDHWAYLDLGIQRIDATVGAGGSERLPGAKSAITSGDNPYPDLPFDPLSTPDGTVRRGLPYYDLGVQPTTAAEVIYVHPDTGAPLGVRKLTSPGVNSNTVYLGFHPYFVTKSAFREFIRAVLTDFGEQPISGS